MLKYVHFVFSLIRWSALVHYFFRAENVAEKKKSAALIRCSQRKTEKVGECGVWWSEWVEERERESGTDWERQRDSYCSYTPWKFFENIYEVGKERDGVTFECGLGK